MPYAQETGYTPSSILTLMDVVRENINTQFGTTYTAESFIGTSFYKYFYALIQELQANEVKTSEIFQQLQGYFDVINARISRPVVTNPGIVEKLETEGYISSVKQITDTDRGKVYICIDVDETDPDYADTKLAINTLISQITVGGTVTQGTESSAIVISNGQSFDFKYDLPTRIEVALRLTITTSENNTVVIDGPDVVKARLLANIEAGYRLGRNFEPQRYFGIQDAPWASSVLLEWTDDVTAGEIDVTPTWNSTVYNADYDDLFLISLELIELVEV